MRGTAWLDHEWSSEYLAAEARGWDWIGINLDDGGALMAFGIRGKDGSRLLGGRRDARRDRRAARRWRRRRALHAAARWRSPRTGIEYPVAMRRRSGRVELELAPLMDDQELDSRASVGTIYWEGAVRATPAAAPSAAATSSSPATAAPLRI